MKTSLAPNEFIELMLSHHPDCQCFKDDVFVICGRRICNGCMIAYPVAILTLILFNPTGIESVALAVFLSFLSLMRRLTNESKIKLLFKVIAGFGLGFGLGGMWWAINIGNWLIIILMIIAALIYLFIRFHSIKQKLLKCKCNKIKG
ncbi:MAG: hypothetical protein QXE90_04425 [Candidatus Micrarchaeia archaeon]